MIRKQVLFVMHRVTHIPSGDSEHGFCKGCWNYWFFCDCVIDFLEDGELVTSDEKEEDGDDNNDDVDMEPPIEFAAYPPMDPGYYTPITPSPPKRPKPNTPILPPDDPMDPTDLFPSDDGNPGTVQGNPGTFVPTADNQIPMPIDPPMEPARNNLIHSDNIDTNEFITDDNKFTWSQPGQISAPFALDPYKYYAESPNPAFWPRDKVVVDPDGSINSEFKFWFNFVFIPSLLSFPGKTPNGEPLIIHNGRHMEPMKATVLTFTCHVDPSGKEWFSWTDGRGNPHLTEKKPTWAEYFYPNQIPINASSRSVNPSTRSGIPWHRGDPRRGLRPTPYEGLIFPDSYTDQPIERRSNPTFNDPNVNNPSNNPGLTGTGVFTDVYRGKLLDNFNISKFVIPFTSTLTNNRATLRSVNGNFGNPDTFLRKESTGFARYIVLNELKQTDTISWALVEIEFSIPVAIATLFYGPNIIPELILLPVSNLESKQTVRARGIATTITLQKVNILIPPGDFIYFDTQNPNIIYPGFIIEIGQNNPVYDWVSLRHFRKSTSRHIEYGARAQDAGQPGQVIVSVPNELPSTAVKTHQTFAVPKLFSLYPYLDDTQPDVVGTKFNFCTRIQPIWNYPVDVDVNLTGGTINKLQFKANAPSGWAYPIIPIGQVNGVGTNVTDGIIVNKSTQQVYDYRLHTNYYSGLWVTTD